MILSFGYQASVFITAVAIGLSVGFAYDILRIIRLIVKHKPWAVNLEDGLFWTAAVFYSFTAILVKNNGEMRFFIILGIGLGTAVYFSMPSLLIMGCAERIVSTVKRAFNALLRPAVKICRFIFTPAVKLNFFLKIRMKKVLHLCKLYAKLRIRKFFHSFKAMGKK